MAARGKYLRDYTSGDGWTGEGFTHWCPACEERHAFAVSKAFNNGARWTFDGNFDAPTFAPSMNIRTGPRPTVPAGRPDVGQIDVCHYFLRAGKIQYLSDCTHALKGQTVELPKMPE